jgi:hypothetical protein
VPAVLARLQHDLVTRAMALAFDDTFRVMVVAAIVGAVIGLALRRNYAAQAAVETEEAEIVPSARMAG